MTVMLLGIGKIFWRLL